MQQCTAAAAESPALGIIPACVVTGAGSGIGRALSLWLVRQGTRVAALSRRAETLASLAAECAEVEGAHGGAAAQGAASDSAAMVVWEAVDVSDVGATRAALGRVCTRMGGVPKWCVNNAGVSVGASFWDTTVEQWDTVMHVNVRAAFVVSKWLAQQWFASLGIDATTGDPSKKPLSHCAIVNVSSQASSVALPEHSAYCVSKAALDQLTRCQALELGGHGVRCNAVCPTVVLTAMGRAAWGDAAKAGPMLQRIPLGRFAQEDEVVQCIDFLLRSASMVNGAMLPIDGGFLAAGMAPVVRADEALNG